MMFDKESRDFLKGAAVYYLVLVLVSFSIVLPVFIIFEFEFKRTVYIYLSFQPLLYVLGIVIEAEFEINKGNFLNELKAIEKKLEITDICEDQK